MRVLTEEMLEALEGSAMRPVDCEFHKTPLTNNGLQRKLYAKHYDLSYF